MHWSSLVWGLSPSVGSGSCLLAGTPFSTSSHTGGVAGRRSDQLWPSCWSWMPPPEAALAAIWTGRRRFAIAPPAWPLVRSWRAAARAYACPPGSPPLFFFLSSLSLYPSLSLSRVGLMGVHGWEGGNRWSTKGKGGRWWGWVKPSGNLGVAALVSLGFLLRCCVVGFRFLQFVYSKQKL